MEVHKKKEIIEDILKKKRNIIELIVDMKNLAGLTIELGFSALLLQDRKLAGKVKELEEDLDTKQYEIETLCMLAAKSVKQALGLTSVIRVASAVEDISNAVNELTDSIIRGIPPHPTIKEALKSAAETVDFIEMRKKSKSLGKTLEGIARGRVKVIGLKREESWSYLPKTDERVKEGDLLIISGDKKNVKEVLKDS